MLLIHCPYCDETLPEAEFTYGGEAHIARPANPSALSDAEWAEFLFMRGDLEQRTGERDAANQTIVERDEKIGSLESSLAARSSMRTASLAMIASLLGK